MKIAYWVVFLGIASCVNRSVVSVEETAETSPYDIRGGVVYQIPIIHPIVMSDVEVVNLTAASLVYNFARFFIKLRDKIL